ncbi:MAG TPA: VWA domain-containing protein [Arachidicoccus sp.]|nr:VWA domain-containing protein [Arachidicoccus sp.]
MNKKSFLTLVAGLLCSSIFAGAALSQNVVKGIVTNLSGHPLKGILVQTIPAYESVRTTKTGRFELPISTNTTGLAFSAAGFVRHQVQLNGQAQFKVQLQPLQLTPQFTAQPEMKQLLSGRIRGIEVSKSSTAANNIMIRGTGALYGSRAMPNRFVPMNTESYAHVKENGFLAVAAAPLSTFSIDVDKASYSNIRRMIQDGQLPMEDAVRVEELINYFDYNYPQPVKDLPVRIITELGTAPWNAAHRLLQIGIQGKTIPTDNLPASNLVFLIDVSGSMNAANKLPLLVSAFKMLTDRLRPKDQVAIITYAGQTRKVLGSTSGAHKEKIKAALDGLMAGGSTNGEGGLEKAYDMAAEHFMKKGNNRIILATDGDFNIGKSSLEDLEKLIEQKRQSGIYLSVLGFGMGNYKDDKMELLADKGNGNYAYIDNSTEAQRVLLKEFGGTLFTIAKDVKIQVEFNPAVVQAYRLIGYENRALEAQDFKNDQVDAGEMGSGQTVTALYEIIPVGVKDKWIPDLDDLQYQKPGEKADFPGGTNLLTVKLRYKQPNGGKSLEMRHAVQNSPKQLQATSDNFRFAAAVAGLGMLLKHSPYQQQLDIQKVIELARQSRGSDSDGERAGFLQLAITSKALAGNHVRNTEPLKRPFEFYPGLMLRYPRSK